MSWPVWIVSLVALVGVAVTTGFVRRYALRTSLMDEPNARSSHSTPIARGGGLAIVGTCIPIWIVLYILGFLEARLVFALVVGGLGISTVGYLDDRYGMDARLRLVVHFAVAVLAVLALGPSTRWHVGTDVLELGAIGWIVLGLGVAWFPNLFNFMDGIDGLACAEAAFVAIGGGVLGLAAAESSGTSIAAFILGAASLGFLCWNWPPAKIFMGDVGSGFLGYALAVLALSSATMDMAALLPWVILAAVFLADSTVTLLRRLLRGERVHIAHRTHAYQWLARGWRSHGRVTALVMAINIGWLFPLAWWATVRPDLAGRICALAILPLLVASAYAGAGRAERQRASEV